MRKGISYGIKVFFLFFFLLFFLNVIGIRFFGDLLYSAEGLALGFLFCVINGMFARL